MLLYFNNQYGSSCCAGAILNEIDPLRILGTGQNSKNRSVVVMWTPRVLNRLDSMGNVVLGSCPRVKNACIKLESHIGQN